MLWLPTGTHIVIVTGTIEPEFYEPMFYNDLPFTTNSLAQTICS